jgi:hypothetical protein
MATQIKERMAASMPSAGAAGKTVKVGEGKSVEQQNAGGCC